MFTNLDWAEVVEREEENFGEPKRWVDLPAGEYDVVIDKVLFEPAKESKNGTQIPPFIVYELTVLSDGEFKGCGTSKRDGFWNASSASFIKRDILRLGCDVPKNMEEIPVALQKVINCVVSIYVSVKPKSTGGEFRNVYINKLKGKVDSPKTTISPSVKRDTVPMDSETANRLKAATQKPDVSADPFGGVFDGDCEPPF